MYIYILQRFAWSCFGMTLNLGAWNHLKFMEKERQRQPEKVWRWATAWYSPNLTTIQRQRFKRLFIRVFCVVCNSADSICVNKIDWDRSASLWGCEPGQVYIKWGTSLVEEMLHITETFHNQPIYAYVSRRNPSSFLKKRSLSLIFSPFHIIYSILTDGTHQTEVLRMDGSTDICHREGER